MNRKSLALRFLVATVSVVVSGWSAASTGQTLYSSGQNVQPSFEGWERNPDGSFDLVFGYLNRNYVEELDVDIGANNFFEPGPRDRGQPTHFYPRRQSFVFHVTVPADWGKQQLVWTVNHNGRSATAVGSLLPISVLDEGVWRANRQGSGNGQGIFGRTQERYNTNTPPSIKIEGSDKVTATDSQALTLRVVATDDGNPGPALSPQSPAASTRERTKGSEIVETLPVIGGATSATGINGPISQNIVQPANAYRTGLAVTWLHYRGVGKVTFDPTIIPVQTDDKTTGGPATTTVRFKQPGTYVLRAVADDGIYTASVDVRVEVRAGNNQTDPGPR